MSFYIICTGGWYLCGFWSQFRFLLFLLHAKIPKLQNLIFMAMGVSFKIYCKLVWFVGEKWDFCGWFIMVQVFKIVKQLMCYPLKKILITAIEKVNFLSILFFEFFLVQFFRTWPKFSEIIKFFFSQFLWKWDRFVLF